MALSIRTSKMPRMLSPMRNGPSLASSLGTKTNKSYIECYHRTSHSTLASQATRSTGHGRISHEVRSRYHSVSCGKLSHEIGKFLYMNDEEAARYMTPDLLRYPDGHYYFTYVPRSHYSKETFLPEVLDFNCFTPSIASTWSACD